MENNELTQAIIGAAIEVHRRLGPGLLDKAQTLSHLRLMNLRIGLLINFGSSAEFVGEKL